MLFKIKKTIEYLFYFFVFFLPWQTAWIWQEGILGGAKWEYGTMVVYGSEILLWLIILFWFVLSIKERKSKVKSQKSKVYIFIFLYFYIFILWSGLSIIWSADKSLAFYWYFHLLEAVALFFVVINLKIDWRKFFWALALSGVAQSVLAVWQFLSQQVVANKWLGIASHFPADLGASVVSYDGYRWLRAYGSFNHPNALGGFLAVCFLIALFLYFNNTTPPPCLKRGVRRTGSSEASSEGARLNADCRDHKERQALPRTGGRSKIKTPPNGPGQSQSLPWSRLSTLASLASARRYATPLKQGEEHGKKILSAASVVVIFAGLFFSFSRSAWLAAGVGYLIFIIVKTRRRLVSTAEKKYVETHGNASLRGLVKITVYLIVIAVILFFIYQPLVTTRFTQTERLEIKSSAERVASLGEAGQTIKENWLLGVGVGNYTYHQYQKNPGQPAFAYQPAHNLYLLIFSELGVVGFIIFIFLYFYIFITSLKILKNNPVPFILVVTLLIAGLFDHYFWTSYFGLVFFWLVLAIILHFRVRDR
ncbi:MAG: O-antigen ligase family protein [Patescibacteria group bacterium]